MATFTDNWFLTLAIGGMLSFMATMLFVSLSDRDPSSPGIR